MQVYQRKITRAYNKLVKPRIFQEEDLVNKLVKPRIFQKEDLVLKAADHAMKGLQAPKFTPKWKGPYDMVKVKSFGYYIMKDLNTSKNLPTNLKFVKKNHL